MLLCWAIVLQRGSTKKGNTTRGGCAIQCHAESPSVSRGKALKASSASSDRAMKDLPGAVKLAGLVESPVAWIKGIA